MSGPEYLLRWYIYSHAAFSANTCSLYPRRILQSLEPRSLYFHLHSYIMKSSLAFATILLLPDVFAVAVPQKNELASKRFAHAVEDTIDSAPGKRDAISEPERNYFEQVATQSTKDLKRDGHFENIARRSWYGWNKFMDLLPRWHSAAQEVKELKPRGLAEHRELVPRRGRPLVVSPTSTPYPTTTPADPAGYLPSDPAQSYHNSLVGGHPWAGHGPAIVTAASSYKGMYDTNITITVPALGTAPPIANVTATLYAPAAPSCHTMPVGEYVDSRGNFLPTDQQPGYNGSISTNGTTLVCDNPMPIAEDEVLIQGHVEDDTEIVEIDIIPLPNNSTANTYYDADYTPSPTTTNPLPSGPYNSGLSSTTSAPGSMGTGTRQRVPDAGNPGFTGPKVRDLH